MIWIFKYLYLSTNENTAYGTVRVVTFEAYTTKYELNMIMVQKYMVLNDDNQGAVWMEIEMNIVPNAFYLVRN